jgi:hypothetical protein
MSRATAEPDAAQAAGAGVALFPWLFSSTVHTLVFLGMAVSWSRTPVGAPAAGGVSLEVSLLSSASREGDAPTIHLDAPHEAGYFDDDQPVLAEPSPAAGGGSPALSTLLDEEPAVSTAGVLPGGGAELGRPGPTEGIAASSQLTGQPAPARRLAGGRALTGVFGLQGEGYKFVYVFDRSGSMDGHGGAPLAAAKAELVSSLQNLGSTHQFQIIFYNEEPRIFSPGGNPGRLVFGTDQNKNLARRFVGSITASGATRHVEALLMALRLNPDVIFFLTDADEPQITPPELARIAQMNEGTAINTIEFGTMTRLDSENFLVKLARQNGGQHVYIDLKRLQARSSAAP